MTASGGEEGAMERDEPQAGQVREVSAPAGDDDQLEGVVGLPRVVEVGVVMRAHQPAPERPKEPRKAAVAMDLKQLLHKPKRAMVTMSDMALDGRPRGGVQAKRQARKPG
jgi:hypothetical protein